MRYKNPFKMGMLSVLVFLAGCAAMGMAEKSLY